MHFFALTSALRFRCGAKNQNQNLSRVYRVLRYLLSNLDRSHQPGILSFQDLNYIQNITTQQPVFSAPADSPRRQPGGPEGGVCCLLFRWIALDCGTRSVPRDAVSRNCDWLAILADLNNSRWPGGFFDFVDINKPSHLFPAIRRRRKLALVLIA